MMDHLIADGVIQKLVAQDRMYNTVYVYGSAARTAAMAACAEAEMRRARPNAKIIHITGSAFYADVLSRCRQGELSGMLHAYTGDLLILEDISPIAGAEMTEQELYGILDWFLEHEKQLLITGDAPPDCVQNLAPRIRAQLNGGICIAIE
jgi:chromosomal replication initiator protein